MNIREQANQLLALAAEPLKLEQLELDERDECIVTFDDRIVTVFTLDADDLNGLVINLVLGALPPDEARGDVMRELLAGNYCWGRTEGGVIGIEDATEMICLTYLVELPMAHPEQFPDVCAKLLNAADYWQRRIEAVGGVTPDMAPAGSLSSGVEAFLRV